MPETTFLRFRDEHGVTAEGHLEPLVQIGIAIPVPVMIPNPATKDLEPGETAQKTYINPAETLEETAIARIVPGTRLIEVADSRIANALLLTGNWETVEPPTRAAIASEAKALTDALAEAGTHSDADDRDGLGTPSTSAPPAAAPARTSTATATADPSSPDKTEE